MGPIQIDELGFNDTFEKFDRLADLIEELNQIVDELKEEGIEIKLKIELK